jgi:histidine ammonia-lyase
LDFHKPKITSPLLQKVHQKVRTFVVHYDKDRYFAPDIAVIKKMILSGEFLISTK